MLDIAKLNAKQLLALGGLVTRCSAPLICVAHGLAAPCESCEDDNDVEVACKACNHVFSQGIVEANERPCASEAEFGRTGKIAFEAVARASLVEQEKLAEEMKRLEAKRLARLEAEKKKQKEIEERGQREKAAQIEAQRARDLKAKQDKEDKERKAQEAEAQRKLKEKLDAKRQKDEAHRLAEESRKRAEALAIEGEHLRKAAALDAAKISTGEGRRIRAIIASFIATISGAWMVINANVLPLQQYGLLIPIAYWTLVIIFWAIGVWCLFENRGLDDTLRPWSFTSWAFVSFAWPAVMTFMILNRLDTENLLRYRIVVIGVTLFVGITCMRFGGVGMSMTAPWPKGFSEKFRGRRSWFMWIGLTITLFYNALVLQDSPFLTQIDTGPENASTSGEMLVVNADTLNCRVNPIADSGLIGTLVKGQTLRVVEPERLDGWVKLEVEDTQCWAKEIYLSPAQP
jgi:hypothetical protein